MKRALLQVNKNPSIFDHVLPEDGRLAPNGRFGGAQWHSGVSWLQKPWLIRSLLFFLFFVFCSIHFHPFIAVLNGFDMF